MIYLCDVWEHLACASSWRYVRSCLDFISLPRSRQLSGVSDFFFFFPGIPEEHAWRFHHDLLGAVVRETVVVDVAPIPLRED